MQANQCMMEEPKEKVLASPPLTPPPGRDGTPLARTKIVPQEVKSAIREQDPQDKGCDSMHGESYNHRHCASQSPILAKGNRTMSQPLHTDMPACMIKSQPLRWTSDRPRARYKLQHLEEESNDESHSRSCPDRIIPRPLDFSKQFGHLLPQDSASTSEPPSARQGSLTDGTQSGSEPQIKTRPSSSRTVSMPVVRHRSSSAQLSKSRKDTNGSKKRNISPDAIPLPPASMNTHLELELSAQRPPPSYIRRASHYDVPYESSRLKLERLQDFLLLPPQLECTLVFGALCCMDAWLFTFTILPLRFLKAFVLLSQSLLHNIIMRPWSRTRRHQKQMPSRMTAEHKADLLRGLLIAVSCSILMHLDASRMYHSIRGQAAIKLYVIYNVLEVCDRLFSALGQDVLECLFSKECLERKSDGRSKIMRPFWLFLLALAYNLVHSTTLFYQAITLNVAVNSYSNALLTLLMSNQFVEIKSTVFKKFEKDNLFQLTCADVVERFQLWLMLLIIASRNLVETGGTTVSPTTQSPSLVPAWMGDVLAPFVVVLGSEMLVDWFKHAYITKFNNTKPVIYGRFLDVLAKDYYSDAFVDQNLNRRLGLPVIPLACLFIRASVQTYHMFITTCMPPTVPATTTSLDTATTSPATTEVLTRIDLLLRQAWQPPNTSGFFSCCLDAFLPYILPLTIVVLIFLLLLSLKLLLGMALLSFARRRYSGMRGRSKVNYHANGRRVGGWGTIELDHEKKRHIFADDVDGLARTREREDRERRKASRPQEDDFSRVQRYAMVGKRIW